MNESNKDIYMQEQTKKPIINICFRVWGDDLHPEDISQILKIKPSEMARRGDVQVSKKTGSKLVVKTGRWFLKTNEHVNSIRVIDHINFVLALLKESKEPLHQSKEIDKLALTLIIGVDEDDDSVEFDLDPETLMEISQQKIQLSITII